MSDQQNEQKQAGASWVVAGFIFGLFAWLIALATDNGDGRANKALSGCLVWVAILAIFILMSAV